MDTTSSKRVFYKRLSVRTQDIGRTRQKLTASVKSSSSRGFVPVIVAESDLVPVTTGDSPEAKCTSPSRNAYSASKNAFVILDTKTGAIEFCFVTLGATVLDERSTPPAILNADVVRCLWNVCICNR